MKDSIDKKELYSALPYYHSVGKKRTNVVKYIIRFHEEVDGDALRKAVDTAIQRYPYFRVKIVENAWKTYLVPNDAPMVISHSMEPVHLGSEASNHHLMAFGYWDNNLFIYNFHGLMDGRGRGPFQKTLLYYYCMFRYNENVEMDNVNLADSPVDPEEYLDPFNNDIPQNRKIKLLIPKSFGMRLIKMGKVTPGDTRIRLIKLPEKETIDWCKQHDATPNTAVSALMCRAIHQVHPDSKKSIIAGVCCDLRSALNVRKPYASLVYFLHLAFDQKMVKQDLDTQLTEFRGQLILQSDPDILRRLLGVLKYIFAFINAVPSRVLKRLVSRLIMSSIYKQTTFGVSYTGKVSYGSCDKHIKGLYSEPNTPDAGIFIEITAGDGNLMLTFAQEWESDIYFDAFCQQLEENGLKYKTVFKELANMPEMS